MKKFKIMHLIGSTRTLHADLQFLAAERYYTSQGYIVFKPVFYNVPADYPKLSMLTDMCSQKLEMCDVVCVVGQLGESTKARIAQAEKLGKEIIFY